MNAMADFLPQEIVNLTKEGRAVSIQMRASEWLSILRTNTKSVSELRNELSELITIIEESKNENQRNIFIVSKNNQNIAAVVPLLFLENMLRAQDTLNTLIEALEEYQESTLLEEAFKRWNNAERRYNLVETIEELKINPDKLLNAVQNQKGSLLE
ncbi:hypothetical protein L7E55_14710 [Pelotomaculum isophthalicicum JI]|uniref:Uncharacterized protein n=1 Tax=Pelotomaculum isophthalicicum JI TaxID=947010 RepID=A0A9X4H6U6_9FIRM|nr:hypothetical protein [Pelotomaculum isophthalicicum]MDF9409587.1 hypothetical protein [Pelotomaculum isophthalicicum JI]